MRFPKAHTGKAVDMLAVFPRCSRRPILPKLGCLGLHRVRNELSVDLPPLPLFPSIHPLFKGYTCLERQKKPRDSSKKTYVTDREEAGTG